MADSYAVDSSVALAILLEEGGWEGYASRIAGQYIASVNAAEVVGRLTLAGLTVEAASNALRYLGMTIAAFDEQDAIAAGVLTPVARPLGLSLGDRACLAFAKRRGLGVLTTDRAWAGLDIGVAIEVVR